MLKSAKHSRNIGLKVSVLYVKMSHQPCLGNKIPLSRVLPGSFPNCAGIFCKRWRRDKMQLWARYYLGTSSLQEISEAKRGRRASTILVVKVIYLRHVSKEDILPVPQHGRHKDDHGRVVHLSSVALQDAKLLSFSGFCLASPQRQRTKGCEQTSNIIYFGSNFYIPFLLSLNTCLLAHQHSVHKQVGLWSSRERHGTAFLGWVNTVEMFWSQKPNCSHFLLTTARLVPQEYLSGLNTSAVTTLAHEWQRVCTERAVTDGVTRPRVQGDLLQSREGLRSNIKINGLFALAQDVLNSRILLFSILAASEVCPLLPHLPLAITASQKEAFAANCWVELANSAKLSAGKRHYYTNTKPATRCGNYRKCRRAGRQSQQSGPPL